MSAHAVSFTAVTGTRVLVCCNEQVVNSLLTSAAVLPFDRWSKNVQFAHMYSPLVRCRARLRARDAMQ